MNPHPFAKLSVCIAMTALLLALPGSAAEPAAGPENAGKAPNVERTYTVTRLLVPIPDFTDAPDLSLVHDVDALAAPANGLFNAPVEPPNEMTRAERAAKLVAWISNTITPDVWKAGGIIRELNGTLTTIAPQETQDALAAALKALERRQDVQVTLEWRIMTFSSDDLKTLPPELVHKLDQAAFPLAPQIPARLNEKEVNLLLRAVQNSRVSTFVTAPRITLFSGQRAYVLVAQQKAFVSGYTPKKDGIGFDPKVKITEYGIVLDAQATASEDHKQIAVHVAIQHSALLGMTKSPFAGAPRNKDLVVETPYLRIRELRATASIQDGQTVLIGRVDERFVPAEQAGIKGDEKPAPAGERMIVLVKANVIVETEK